MCGANKYDMRVQSDGRKVNGHVRHDRVLGDREGYERTDPAVRDAAYVDDARLRSGGAVMGVAGAPVQVSNHDAAGVQTESGPLFESSLPVAGFALIQAAGLAEAVEIVSQTPCAVAAWRR